MRFRNGVVAIGLMVAGEIVCGAALAAEKIEWHVSLWGTRRPFTEGVELLSSEAAKRTGGNFIINLHYGGVLAAPKENLDGVNIRAFEMAAICVSYTPGKTPAMTGLDLPFLPIPNIDVQRKVHEAYYAHPAVVKEMDAWNTKAIFSNLLDRYEIMGTGEAPSKMDDLKGLRVRALGGQGEAMRLLGAVPTSVPAPELYTALERGVLTAASFPFPGAMGEFRLHEVSRWFTSNMNLGVLNCPLIVNKDALAGLPDEYRQMIYDMKPAMYEAMKQAYAEDGKWLSLFRQNLKEVTFDPTEVEAMRERGAEPIWSKWVIETSQRKIPAKELLDLILETAKNDQG